MKIFLAILVSMFLLIAGGWLLIRGMPLYWYELSKIEIDSIVDYRKEIGNDFIYCRKVRSGQQAFMKITKRLKMEKITDKNKYSFPAACWENEWWIISKEVKPCYVNIRKDDTAYFVVMDDGFVYFSSQSW